MEEKKYEEIGLNYRFFLGWRHAAFAGILVVIYGVISLTITVHKEYPIIAWLIPLGASPIGFLLCMIDHRTRDLYHAAIQAGKDLEGEKGGFYTRLREIALPKGTSAFKKITHSAALDILFIGTSLAFILLSFSLLIIHLFLSKCP